MVTIENLDKMAMPIILEYETTSGKKDIIKLPVEIWNNTSSFKIKIPVSENVKSVTLDPEKLFPDMNYANNKWNL